MDGDTAASPQDQISLYGLFGDSSTMLQGLNDHLSPSLLQQSPPCGSASGQTAHTRAVIMSPPKQQSLSNGVQHSGGGVLLSDLADRSPSAGTITAASLCNYVSYGNQRCTNLVTIKGRRYCSQHCGEPVSLVQKAIFKKPLSSTNIKQAEGFVPITKSNIVNTALGQKIVQPGSNSTLLAAMSTVRTSPAITITTKQNGIDVPDNIKSVDHSSVAQQLKGQQLHLVKKVGKKITVSKRQSPLIGNEANKAKLNSLATVVNPGSATLPGQSSSKISFKTNSVRVSTPSCSIPYYKKLEPVNVSAQIRDARMGRIVNARTQTSNGTKQQPLTALTPNKASGGDEALIKKLIEVLNEKDLSPQEQLNVLQSMGVTIVQGPLTSAVEQSKKKPQKVHKTNTAGCVPPGIRCSAGAITQSYADVAGSSFLAGNVKIGEKQGISKVLAEDQKSEGNMKTRPISGKAGKNVSNKPGQKRKQKTANEVSQKKSKSDWKVNGDSAAPTSIKKTPSTKIQSERTKQKKNNVNVQQQVSLLRASPRPKFLKIPLNASYSFNQLSRFTNERILLENDLFADYIVEVERNVTKADKGKALKRRMLRKHLAKRRSRNGSGNVNYEQCLEDLDSSDTWKALGGAKKLLELFFNSKRPKNAVHHERIMDKLLTRRNDIPGYTSTIRDGVDISMDEKTLFTLDTMLMRDKYEKLFEDLDREELELELLTQCIKEDKVLATKAINNFLGDKSARRPAKLKKPLKARVCQLSFDEGLKCSKRSLPYANYCKEHIWHCETQCLYKLDQNMKTVPDITPEPLVKRVKKRAKLLPLIKKYKKKKKKKIEGAEQACEAKGELKTSKIPKQRVKNDGLLNRVGDSHISHPFPSIALDQSQPVSDVDGSKRSESSDDDLNLMSNELMLSGVLDKLQNDVEDFDLFSEKNVEELERALLMAVASPISEEQPENDISPSEGIAASRPDTLPNLNSRLELNPRSNSSPNAIVNCDAPKSNGTPPSLNKFDESQIAHYTFGSSVGVKKDDQNESFPIEDSVPPLISAEDLQDLEGVLERLDAEDANSPKLPSSPAIDQYTSMLARQLSQEVECETLKREASSSSVTQPACHNFKTQSQSISTSFSLPTPRLSPASSPLSKSKPAMSFPSTVANNSVPPSPTGQFRKPSASVVSSHVTVTPTVENTNVVSFQQRLLPPVQKNVTSQTVNPSVVGAAVQFSCAATAGNTAPPVDGKLKSSKSVVLGNINLSSSTQGKVQRSASGVVQNHMVPFTVMQTQQSQNGNVIKVIVPPGTIINGANGQQNMLLIPVSALVKSNMQSGNASVLTTLSQTSAGQQFFIVNNASAGTSQTHLALVQKPGSSGPQQGIILKSQGTPLKDPNTYVRQRMNQEQAKATTGMKSGSVTQLKHTVRQAQDCKAMSFVTSSTISSNVSYTNAQTLSSGTVTKIVAAEAGKMTAPRNQGGRRKGKNTPRKPKARFDPITRKYVPVTDTPVSSSGVEVPSPVSMPSHSNMSESLMKFNESTLSIQNKVQQIDSVLSSLNAASKSQAVTAKGHQEPTKTKHNSVVGKSTALTTQLTTASTTTHKFDSTKPTIVKTVVSPILTNLPAKNAITAPSLPSPLRQTNSASAAEKASMIQVQKTTLVNVKSDSNVKKASKSNIVSPLFASKKAAPVVVSSGTVHWNQTTTAGPEIASSTMTVPVYFTGTIPGNTWNGELTLAKSPSGATLPVILPSRKAGVNGQLPQRVFVGSIGSHGLTRVSAVSNGAVVKHSVISVPHGVVTMPKTIVGASKTGKSFSTRPNAVHVNFSKAQTPVTESVLKASPASKALVTPSFVDIPSGSVSKTMAVVVPPKLIWSNDNAWRKKSGRKTSHDMILHDPSMSDPTGLNPVPSSQ